MWIPSARWLGSLAHTPKSSSHLFFLQHWIKCLPLCPDLYVGAGHPSSDPLACVAGVFSAWSISLALRLVVLVPRSVGVFGAQSILLLLPMLLLKIVGTSYTLPHIALFLPLNTHHTVKTLERPCRNLSLCDCVDVLPQIPFSHTHYSKVHCVTHSQEVVINGLWFLRTNSLKRYLCIKR